LLERPVGLSGKGQEIPEDQKVVNFDAQPAYAKSNIPPTTALIWNLTTGSAWRLLRG